ncbi:hypothetical protein M432DRAFT_641411 [Thermoascus aurantiacus ATCC 26904]
MTVLISRYAFSSAGHGASLQSLCASDGLAGPLAAWPGFGPTADGGSGPPQRWPRAERHRSVSSARRSRPLLPASLLPAASGLVPEDWASNPPGSVPEGSAADAHLPRSARPAKMTSETAPDAVSDETGFGASE